MDFAGLCTRVSRFAAPSNNNLNVTAESVGIKPYYTSKNNVIEPTRFRTHSQDQGVSRAGYISSSSADGASPQNLWRAPNLASVGPQARPKHLTVSHHAGISSFPVPSNQQFSPKPPLYLQTKKEGGAFESGAPISRSFAAPTSPLPGIPQTASEFINFRNPGSIDGNGSIVNKQ